MPAVARSRPKRFNYRKLPVWVQWTLPFGVAAVVVVALVVFVHHETTGVPAEAGISAKQLNVENQQAATVIRQQQAPHSVRLAAGIAPAAGLKAAITTWLAGQIKTGQMDGPVTRFPNCSTRAGSTAARVAMQCTPFTANVKYYFDGVVIPSSHSITYCQWIKYPPQFGMPRIPLSKSCLAS